MWLFLSSFREWSQQTDDSSFQVPKPGSRTCVYLSYKESSELMSNPS